MKKINTIKACLIFFLTSLIFNNYVYLQIFSKQSSISLNDTVVTEFINETSYQNLINKKDPFETDKLFHPLKTEFAFNDSAFINEPFFLLLRPFVDSYNILYLIVAFNVFLAYLFMYFLLRKLKISESMSILGSLIFAFTPFISHRISSGHLTYTTIYFFPLLTLLLINTFDEKQEKLKLLLSGVLGVFVGLLFYANPHYFISILIGIAGLLLVYLIKTRNLERLLKNYKHLLIITGAAFIVLLPVVFRINEVKDVSNKEAFKSSLTLSADATSFLTPNYLNPFYRQLFEQVATRKPVFAKFNQQYLNSDYSFAYPGFLIILAYFLFFFWKKKNKFKLDTKISYFFWLSLVFLVLSLGPLLKIFNRWSLNLEGVPVSIPLPFLLFKYVPVLNIIRAPIRFTPLFIFFATVTAAYILDNFLIKAGKKKLLLLSACLFAIFFFDQAYVINPLPTQKIPFKIYSSVKGDREGTVLEIPFTVRDGLRYEGFVHALMPMKGVLIHGKPIIGGYLARVDSRTFDFYNRFAVIDYFQDVIDKGNYDPVRAKPQAPVIKDFEIDDKKAEEELNELKIRYVILKNDEEYSDEISKILTDLGFNKKMRDESYDLYSK